MILRTWVHAVRATSAAFGPVLFGLICGTTSNVQGQAWTTYSHDPQHTCQSAYGSQLPEGVRWQTPVDLAPVYSGGDLLTHYGSPLITSANTVLVPVKTTSRGGFKLEARSGTDGSLIWAFASDYVLPSHNWIPPWGPTLTPNDAKVVLPAAGGTLLARTNPNSARGNLTRLAFFGISNYKQDPAAFNAAIKINTPITSDASGNLYFGYVSTGAALPGYPNGIPSGLARVSGPGLGTFASAASMSGDSAMTKVVGNCAPAITSDGTSVYVGVDRGNFSRGHLCKLDSSTLARQASVALRDPNNSGNATMSDDGTASPTIGPDGDVYYGVLEARFPSNHARGWMLHFSGDLSTSKIPGAFGWDDTASIVPAPAVPQYGGGSSYLILTKYNNYAGVGGDGRNRLAILDPNATQVDPITGATVMKEVITILGPTPDTEFGGGAVREWCINSAAIDAANKCAVVNNEDGHAYRWDFSSNSLSPAFPMAPPTGEAYTSTLIGPDGAVYAINNAVLYCCASGSGIQAGATGTTFPAGQPIITGSSPGGAKIPPSRVRIINK